MVPPSITNGAGRWGTLLIMDTTMAYREGRARITSLLRTVDVGDSLRRVPACPEWTVKDVAAHLCGLNADILAGHMEGVTTEPWTQAQVDARSGATLGEVLDEWDEIGPRVEELLAGGQLPAQMVFDLATHEHDLRHALGSPGARDADSTEIGLDWRLESWARNPPSTPDAPGRAMRVVIGERTVQCGDGEPGATLDLDPFEAFRTLGGRRSVAQICAYDWNVDPEPWLPWFSGGPLRPAPHDIVE